MSVTPKHSATKVGIKLADTSSLLLLLLLDRIAVLCTYRCALLLQTEQRGMSVCRSVTVVSSAKMAEPIKMPFGLWNRVSQTNHGLDAVQIPMEKGNFSGEGEGGAIRCKVYGRSAVSCGGPKEPCIR